MKRFLSMFMSIVMLLSITAGMNITANAEVFSGYCGAEGDGSNLTWSLNENTKVLTISGTGEMKDYSFEDEAPWCSRRYCIASVVVNSGVTSISNFAFNCCYKLENVSLPNTLNRIGDRSFENCESLKDIVLPESITSIGDSAFWDCSSLTKVSIPNGVTELNNSQFRGCSSLSTVSIPSSISNIDWFTFFECSSLTCINVDDNNQTYSSKDGVLFNKDKTELIIYPCSKNDISYSVPSSVKSIKENAFYNCSRLTTVKIPSSVSSVGSWQFYNCSAMTDFYVDESSQYYSSQDGVLFNKDKTSLIVYPISNPRSSYSIPEGVLHIPLFEYCKYLKNLTIPSTVDIGNEGQFSFCTSLQNINVDSNNETLSSQDGVLFNKDKSKILSYPIGSTRLDYIIPDCVISINERAFENSGNLQSITIPNSVKNIYPSAFRSCTNLTTVTISNSVESINWYSFDDCYNLKDVYYSGTIDEWYDLASIFYNPNSPIYVDDSLAKSTIHCTDGVINCKHNWDDGKIINSPTCIKTGEKEYTCKICGEKNTESIDVISHDFGDNRKFCSVCGADNPNYNEQNPSGGETSGGGSTDPENPGGSTGGGGSIGGGGGGGFVPATPEEPATTEPTTQPSTKPSAPATTTTKKPSTVKVEKVTKGTKSFKVTWKKKTGVSGYQLQYATDKKFKKNKKTVTIAKKNATSKTIKKLKAKKTYYVRVRTYKIVNGKKVYSSWSKVKAVKTK